MATARGGGARVQEGAWKLLQGNSVVTVRARCTLLLLWEVWVGGILDGKH